MDEVFSLIYFGKGFTHSEVWNMPISYRKFYLNKVQEVENKKAEAAKQSVPKK